MTTVPSSAYYVYLLCYPDGTPFYIGKGTGGRVFHHLREAFRPCLCRKCSIIRDIWATGEEVRHVIAFESDDPQAAYKREAELIDEIGRDVLVNMQDGWTFPQKREPAVRIRKRAKAGSGSVFQENGRWRGAISYTGLDGKRKRKFVRGDTPEEVRQRMDAARRRLETEPSNFGSGLATGIKVFPRRRALQSRKK